MELKTVLTATVLILTSGCASIEHTAKVEQSLDNTLIAGIGDVVLSVERERNLENVFGKSDIFGRKTKEGSTELRFAGIENDGTVVLYRKDVEILTNETTMSRTPTSTSTSTARTSVTGTASTYGNTTTIQGTGTTSASSTTTLPVDDYHIVVPSDTIAIRLEPGETKLPLSGYVIEIISVSNNSIEYKIGR